MNAEQIKEMYELFESIREEVVTDEQFARLDQMLAENKQICKYYYEYINMITLLKSGKAFDKKQMALSAMDSSLCDLQLWQEMAEHEKASPGIKVVSEIAREELVQEVRCQKPDRKISKGSLFTLFAAAAAIILIFVFAWFAPPATGFKVAILSDSINAKWADVDGTMEKGTPILTSRENLHLREGYAKLLFDNRAQVTIEGPSEFKILAEDKIDLRYGKLYVTVPPQAIGFMITTQSAKIIDLGTEFGVQTTFEGSTELYVYKGKTTLIAGDLQDDKQAIEVTAGKAKRIRSDNQIDDISLKENLFVRDFDSSKQFYWRGQSLSLASLVAGGDGFTRGLMTSGIDPASGDVHLEVVQKANLLGKNVYKSVGGRPFIDGVFVPNGAEGVTVVSSAGHVFTFPQTDSCYFSDITSYPYVLRMKDKEKLLLSLKDVKVQRTDDPTFMFVHSNAGITFSLDKIRRSLPHLEIDEFRATCGVSEGRDKFNKSEFWILVDGACVFHQAIDKDHPSACEINIPLRPEQQFLTLVVTDGGDGNSLDWCVYDNPRLMLVKKQQEANKTNRDTGVEK